MPPALVLNGHVKSALSVVRSLGKKGIPVICGAERSTAMACHSRYAHERFVYPSPQVDQKGFIDAVRKVAEKCERPPVVYALSDATFLTLYQYRAELEGLVVFAFPDENAVWLAFDKASTHSEAKILGVPVIKTHLPERLVEVERLGAEIEYPAVVKPRHSVAWKDGVGVFGTAQFVQNQTQLINLYNVHMEQTGEPPLVQPLMEGEEYGVELLVQNGVIHAETIHHRIRSMSPTGGASVMKETEPPSMLADSMREYAEKMVRGLSWTGPMMVEFKVDGDTREPKLMELNGRWWGSLPLAITAGVDFPFLYYNMVTQGKVPSERAQARAGVVTRHFLGDVRHLLRVWFARDPMRSRLYPRRRKALRDFFRIPKGTTGDVWSWRDPLPSVMEYIDNCAKILKR